MTTFRYRDGANALQEADVVGKPRIDVKRAGDGFSWRLSFRARLATGKDTLRWEGTTATADAAAGEARAWMTQLLGGLPDQGWEENMPRARPPAPRKPTREERRLAPKLVRAQEFHIPKPLGPLRTIKRDCFSGRFAPGWTKANDCKLPERKRIGEWWRDQSDPAQERVCYRSKGDALRLFRHWNRDIIEAWGGIDLVSAGGGEFDSVNERYGLKGRRRARTLGDAINAAMPAGTPYCLDRLDLEALNETTPGQTVGPFRLPDVVEEHKLLSKMEKEYERMEEGGYDF